MGIIRHVTGNAFLNSVSILASATLLSHVLLILSSPVLTRLYTPEQFGLLALFLAIISSLAPGICGKYEAAILLPVSSRKAEHLFIVSLLITTGLSVLLFLFLLITGDSLLAAIDAEGLGNYIFLAPLGLFLTGLIQGGSFFANRHKRYADIARSLLVQTIIIIVLSILLGLGNAGLFALVVSYIIGFTIRAGMLTGDPVIRGLPGNFQDWKMKWMLMRRFRDFPVFNASSGMLNGITLALPVFFLNSFTSQAFVGFYLMAQRVISQPMNALATAISPVNQREIVEKIHAGVAIVPYLFRLFLSLALIAALPVVIIFLFAEAVIPWLFGKQWAQTAIIAEVMCVPFALRFITTSMASTYGATNNSRIVFVRRVVSFLILMGVFFIASVEQDEMSVIYILAGGLILDDLVSLFLIFLSGARPSMRWRK